MRTQQTPLFIANSQVGAGGRDADAEVEWKRAFKRDLWCVCATVKHTNATEWQQQWLELFKRRCRSAVSVLRCSRVRLRVRGRAAAEESRIAASTAHRCLAACLQCSSWESRSRESTQQRRSEVRSARSRDKPKPREHAAAPNRSRERTHRRLNEAGRVRTSGEPKPGEPQQRQTKESDTLRALSFSQSNSDFAAALVVVLIGCQCCCCCLIALHKAENANLLL